MSFTVIIISIQKSILIEMIDLFIKTVAAKDKKKKERNFQIIFLLI